MKRSAALLSALIACSAAHAQIYQYKDSTGTTVYSDQPPPSSVKPRVVKSQSGSQKEADSRTDATKPAGAPATPKTAADREMEFAKRQKERQTQAEKDQKDAAAAAERKDNCERAQRQLQALESGARVAIVDANGERSFLDDDQRSREIERNRKVASENCGK